VENAQLVAGCGDLEDLLEPEEPVEAPDEPLDEDESLDEPLDEPLDEEESLDEPLDEDESLDEEDVLSAAAGLRLSLR
jgi:hypothetical protein